MSLLDTASEPGISKRSARGPNFILQNLLTYRIPGTKCGSDECRKYFFLIKNMIFVISLKAEKGVL